MRIKGTSKNSLSLREKVRVRDIMLKLLHARSIAEEKGR
jgi:hypothetical protein